MNKRKKIAFYSPHLSERGTETAMYDYAHYNEEILGNESIIIYNPHSRPNNLTAISKFKNRFQVYELSGVDFDPGWDSRIVVPPLDKILKEQQCDAVYMQKGGRDDGIVSSVCRNLILCCSNHCEPHGDAYVYVSKWLSDQNSGGEIPFIPIIIDIPKDEGNLREELEIPEGAVVFGRTGGLDTWNIPWASDAILKALSFRGDIYFIFQNTPKIFDHERVKYIKTTADNVYKSKFISSCDAMIHARFEGESFGQSCAEFSFMNKPVVTWLGSRERSHIELLGERGIYYKNENELFNIFMSFAPSPEEDWNCYKNHTPQIAMREFKTLLLNDNGPN